MKKVAHIIELISAFLALSGFSYGLVAVFKDPGLEGNERLGVAFIGILGFLTSLFIIGHIVRRCFKGEEIDEETKDKQREEEYRKWQQALAEAELNVD